MISVSTVGLRNWFHRIRCDTWGILRNCLVFFIDVWCVSTFACQSRPESQWLDWQHLQLLLNSWFMLISNHQLGMSSLLNSEWWKLTPSMSLQNELWSWTVHLKTWWTHWNWFLSTCFLLLFAHSCLYENFAAEQWISGLNGCSLHLKWDLEALPLGVGRFLFQFDLMFQLGLILSYSFCFGTMFDLVMVDSLTWFASRSPGWINFQQSFQCQSNFKS
jgi:hypothetical protein